MERINFLSSEYDTKENRCNLTLNYRPEQVYIFQNLINKYFEPRSELTEDIKELITGELNLCRDRNIIINFSGNFEKSNTLKLGLLTNFLSNWKKDHIRHLVYNDFENNNSLSFTSSSLESIIEYRFRDDESSKQKLSEIYYSDILFLNINSTSKAFKEEFSKDILKILISMRNDSGLITVILYSGSISNIKTLKDNLNNVYIKSYNLLSKHNKSSTTKTSKVKINEEEAFD